MSTQTMTQLIADYFKTQPVLKAWIFGSYARGEQTPESDIDILILPDKSQHFSLFTLSEMYEDLKELLNREVDLITDGGLMPFAHDGVHGTAPSGSRPHVGHCQQRHSQPEVLRIAEGLERGKSRLSSIL